MLDVDASSLQDFQYLQSHPDWSRCPLRRFRTIGIKPLQLSDWEKLFREVTQKCFGTKCRLYDQHLEIMYSCGDYANLMLMGPRDGEANKEALVSIRNALRKIRLYGKEELGEHQAYYTNEYKKWRDDRMKLAALSPHTRPLEPPGPSKKELLLASQNRLLEANPEEARNEIEKYELTIEKQNKTI
ncbi:hypothetical protein Lal_00039441 [Lupinus albus]|nr:hypothetical protein Lal_00039441 [Lupinus albus]